jgi:hypothetical protein
MRFIVMTLAATALAACSIAPPPQCCPNQPAPAQSGVLHARADEFQSLVDDKLKANWPFGILLNVQYADSSMATVQAYNDTDDAAIWTGTYTAAQAYRYAAAPAGSAEKQAALASVRDAVGALHTLATAPGYAGGLARVVAPSLNYLGITTCNPDPPKKSLLQPCYQTNGLYWLGRTSRDQYTGWFFGEAIAYRLVDDADIRATIRGDIGTMITAIRSWNYKLRGPDGKTNSGTSAQVHDQMRIAWHLIAASIMNEQPYLQWYADQTKDLELGDAYLEDAVSWTNVYYDYYGFNLGFLNSYNMVVLEKEPKLKAFYLDMLETQLYKFVQNTDNVFFDYMTMAARGTTSPETLNSDRAALASFPGPPSVWSCVQPPLRPIDPTSKRLYWINRMLGPLAKMEAFPQSKTPYPLAERCRVDFLWQASPYKESCCCQCSATCSTYSPTYCSKPPSPPPPPPSGYNVYPGADYLVAYWMGRYHGFLTAAD